jgi:ferredoxin-NADP reductase
VTGTAFRDGLPWRKTRVTATRPETDSVRTLLLDVSGWPGHLPGQRLDLLVPTTGGDREVRSYSIASPAADLHVELTVQRTADDDLSPFLVDLVAPGDEFDTRGPVGSQFVWDPDAPVPVALAAGGSGIVPLMAMIRTRARLGRRIPFRLLYACRGPADAIYAAELERHSAPGTGLDVTYAYSRRVPAGWPGRPERVDESAVTAGLWPAELEPLCYVCGPTGFVECVADLLVAGGHSRGRIKTEHAGPQRG